MNDYRQAHRLGLVNKEAKIGHKLGLLSTADGQSHGDGIGPQAKGVLNRADRDIQIRMKGRYGGAFQDQGNASRVRREASSSDALHHHHGVRASPCHAVNDRLYTFDTRQDPVTWRVVHRDGQDPSRCRVLHPSQANSLSQTYHSLSHLQFWPATNSPRSHSDTPGV